MKSNMSATERMAQIALDLDYDAIDPTAREFSKRLLVDALGCAIGGFHSKTGVIVRKVASAKGAETEATLIGTNRKVSCSAAIIANQAMLRYLDYNDDMPISIGPGNLAAAHPSGSLPVALAVSESTGASGKQFIAALVAGYEVIGRLLAGYKTSLEVRGVHHGSALPYGACAMAGRLLGLDARQIANAMGLAGALSVGLDILDAEGEEYTQTKNMADGMLSERGYLAALLAREGLTGPTRIVEGHKGFAEVLLGGSDMFAWSEKPHAPWILNTVIKSVCAEATTHGHLMATIALVIEHDIKPNDIASIIVRTNKRSVHHVGDPIKKHPRNKETADHSAYFLTAMAVLHRKISPKIYDEANFVDPKVTALIDRIELEYGPEFDAIIPSGQATIVLKDGRRLTRRVNREELAGEPSNRMSDARLREKFIECADGVMPVAQVDSIIEQCLGLDGAKDLSGLMRSVQIRSAVLEPQ
jgi:2-methylcitrate dehydratase